MRLLTDTYWCMYTPPKIGIYGFQNKIDPAKWYVGQSRDIFHRWNEYRLLRCKNQSKWYNALKKYGYDGFTPVILEECTIEKLPEREEFWVKEKDCVKNGYNCRTGGFRGWTHSESTIQKLRAANLGKKMSEETKAKLRMRKVSDETKQKISDSLKGNQYRKGKPSSREEKERLSKFFSEIPRTEEWKSNIAKKSTWAGKVSYEARQRTAEKLRGRTRPEDVKKRISETKKGTTRKYLPDGSFIMVKKPLS